MYIYIYIDIHIHRYIYTFICICIYIYAHIDIDIDRDRADIVWNLPQNHIFQHQDIYSIAETPPGWVPILLLALSALGFSIQALNSSEKCEVCATRSLILLKVDGI